MSIRTTREIYRPFDYPEFEPMLTKMVSGVWHPYEIQFSQDVMDYNQRLTHDEREIVNKILKNFVQSEIHIGNFWGDRVADWFKKPEIQNIARWIAGTEAIHSIAYDQLNTTLHLSDYDKLKEDKNLYARIELLINKRAKTNEDILKQIFLYSVMGEGVSLFSSFLVLFAFTQKNLLKNIGQIISWSSLDENSHAEVGCHIFNIMKTEYKLITSEMVEELNGIAQEVVKVEHNLIDRVFEDAVTDVIEKEAVKNFVKDRANKQLQKVGLDPIFEVDKNMLQTTKFFDTIIFGTTVLDFFANKETAYSKGIITFDEVFDDEETSNT